MTAVSANYLYGFERFILQSLETGHVKVTFSTVRHLPGSEGWPFLSSFWSYISSLSIHQWDGSSDWPSPNAW